MEEVIVNQEIDNINDRKCYNCGKVFRKPVELQRHKNRKTPCLIREVDPEHVQHPNRCIYCNKIFAQHCTLTRHLLKCKIKNGGMEILVDKVKYDQENRILKETVKKHEEIFKKQEEMFKNGLQECETKFQEQIERLKKQLASPTTNNINTNNTNINNTSNITNHITINNYLTPNYKFLLEGDVFKNIFKRRLVQTAMEIIPMIWFNADHKENLSTYLVNKSTGETLAYDGSAWKVVPVDTLKKDLRDRAYEITSELITADMLNEFTKYIPAQIRVNKIDDEVIEIEEERVYNNLIENRELVKAHMILNK